MDSNRRRPSPSPNARPDRTAVGGRTEIGTVRFGAFVLDADRRLVTRSGVEVHLTPLAFDLLVLLTNEAPRVVTKVELHERLWPGTFVADTTLTGLVKELRRALEDRDAAAPIVRTAYSVGYAFAAPVRRSMPPLPATSYWIETEGRHVALNEGENVIGRSSAVAVSLSAAGVSRRHACIVIDERGATIQDLGSRNGTMVSNRLLAEAVKLHNGDQIRVGPVRVIFHAVRSEVSTAAHSFPPPE
jgi:DNA-binding winged helix-turn-helix (wHTH) protein